MTKLDDDSIARLWQLNAQFVHDARNPLFMIQSRLDGMIKHWEALVQGYEAAVREGLVEDPLWPGQLSGVRGALDCLRDESSTCQRLIDGYWEELKAELPMPEEKWRGNGGAAFEAVRRESGRGEDGSARGVSHAAPSKWGNDVWFSGGPGEPFDVLLVEDHMVNREVAAEMLELLDCRVTMAGDGDEAVRLWRSAAPRLVLMDLHLPKTDGIAAVERIRQLESTVPKHTPIVGLTASPDDREWRAAVAAGMEECITKPLTVDKLEGLLAKYRF